MWELPFSAKVKSALWISPERFLYSFIFFLLIFLSWSRHFWDKLDASCYHASVRVQQYLIQNWCLLRFLIRSEQLYLPYLNEAKWLTSFQVWFFQIKAWKSFTVNWQLLIFSHKYVILCQRWCLFFLIKTSGNNWPLLHCGCVTSCNISHRPQWRNTKNHNVDVMFDVVLLDELKCKCSLTLCILSFVANS